MLDFLGQHEALHLAGGGAGDFVDDLKAFGPQAFSDPLAIHIF